MKKILKCTILLFFLLQVNFFNLINFSSFFSLLNSYSSKYLICGISIILFFISLFYMKKKQSINGFGVSIVFFCTLVGINIIWSSYEYQQPFFSSITASYYYYILLLYFFLYKVYDHDTVVFTFSTAKIVSCVYSGLLILESFLYTKGISILNVQNNYNGSVVGSGLNVENNTVLGMVRIKEPADFIAFAMVLILVQIVINNKMTANEFLIIFVDMFYLIVVSQTRMYVLVMFILFGVCGLIFIYRYNKKMFTMISLGIPVCGVIGAFFMLNLFMQGNRAISYSVRLEAINFYLSEMPKHSLLGIGFPNTQWTVSMLHGNGLLEFLGYQYYLDDIGIIGFYTVFGLLGVLALILFLISMMNFIRIGRNKGSILILFLFVFLTSGSLILFNVQRIVYLPFIFALMFYFSRIDVNHGHNEFH